MSWRWIGGNTKPVILVNELNIFVVILLVLVKRDIWIIDTHPFLPQLKRFLGSFVERLHLLPHVYPAVELCPQLSRIRYYPIKITQFDLFADMESWVSEYYKFKEVGGFDADYNLGYKNIVCNYFSSIVLHILVIKFISESKDSQDYDFLGIYQDLKKAIQYNFGSIDKSVNYSSPFYNKFSNLLAGLAVTVYAFFFATLRLRIFKKANKEYFLAVDDFGDDRDIELLQSLELEGRQLVVLSPQHEKLGNMGTKKLVGWKSGDKRTRNLPGREVCTIKDGILSINEYFSVIKMLLFDGYKLFLRHGNRPLVLFFKIIAMPYRKAVYRAFFSKYKTRFYWGRDPYNVEHILRRKELNSIGGQSFGLGVSFMMTSAILWPQYRYVNFDKYFVYKDTILNQVYGPTWPTDMKLVSSGSSWVEKKFMGRRFSERSNDIAVFCGVFAAEPEMEKFIIDVADKFFDRNIFLQVRPEILLMSEGRAFVQNIVNRCKNVIHSKEWAYELIFRVRYTISDPSSLVAESLQLGGFSFGFDIPSKQKSNIFRSYKDLVFTSAKKFKARIMEIESGAKPYDARLYSDLVDLTGICLSDRVRMEMGLKPLNKNYPLI